MFITLPLTLIGLGLLIYYLFATASHALPLLIGMTAGFGASSADLSPGTSTLVGAAAFLIAVAAGRFAMLRMASPGGRSLLTAMFAIPAGVAGYAIGGALAVLVGLAGFAIVPASVAAVITGTIAVHRLQWPAR